jgi:hypothetical protein
MTKKKRKVRVFSCLEDFERVYFPKSFEKKKREKPLNAETLGATLARESLDKIKSDLKK